MAPSAPAGKFYALSLDGVNLIALTDIGVASDQTLTLQPRSAVSYAWIDVEDKDARRKARSHVIREAKHRQELETFRHQKLKEGSKRHIASAGAKTKILQHVEQQVELVELQAEQNEEQLEINALVSNANNYLPSIKTVLEGLVDPFDQFPVKLTSPRDLGLVDHCKMLAKRTECTRTNFSIQIGQPFVRSHSCWQTVTTHQ